VLVIVSQSITEGQIKVETLNHTSSSSSSSSSTTTTTTRSYILEGRKENRIFK